MANGVVIFDQENIDNFKDYDGFWLDLNGKAGPNQNCIDQITLMIIIRPMVTSGGELLKPGQVTMLEANKAPA